MIERYRPCIPPESAPTLSLREARPGRPLFVCIPRKVLTHPPIRHRGTSADAGLSVFEFVVGAACAALVRRMMMKESHQWAIQAGKAAMEARRNSAQPVYNKKMCSPREQFETVGSDGYWKARRKFIQARPVDDLAIRCTRTALLHCAGLSNNQRNVRNLSAALRRLQRPVGAFPPLVLSWRGPTTASDQMEIHVNGWWVPRRRYVRVPWPAPTTGAGATALSLYLWLFGADTRATSKTQMRAVNLYRTLGIPLSRPAHAKRSLDLVKCAINRHLAQLNATGALDENWSPTGFEILPGENGTLVHIKAFKAQAAIDDDAKRVEFERQDRIEREREEAEEHWQVESERRDRIRIFQQQAASYDQGIVTMSDGSLDVRVDRKAGRR